MDFSFTEEQIEMKKEAIKFAQKELNHDICKYDHEHKFPRKEWKKCAEFEVQGLTFPEKYGGNECDVLTAMLIMEGLGYGCRDNGLIFSINAQMWSVQTPILQFGTEEQKQKYLPPLINGEIIGAHGMSEPNSGSDAYSMATTAKYDQEKQVYVLKGSKIFVTNGPVADIFVVFATTDKAKGFMGITGFILEKDMEGLSVGAYTQKMGLRTSPMSELYLDNCEVPVSARIGKEGAGSRIFHASMEWERSIILANYIGVMEYQLEKCIQYARERCQFRRPIAKFQSVANRIVSMKMRLETARLLLYKVAWEKEAKGQCPMEAALAKLYLSENLVQFCTDAMRVFGGYGFMKEYEIERDLRDAMGGLFYSGTSDIQKNIIAKLLGL